MQARRLIASLSLALVAFATVGCPAEGGTVIDEDNVILINMASDEVLLSIVDAVDSGDLVIDDALAPAMVTPEPGQALPAATPAQFAWSLPSAARKTPRHGTTSGDFVWIRMEGGGLAAPIDAIAVDVTNWTPTADEWARITAATGEVTITLTSAFVDNGVLMEGPFRRTSPSTFSISQ
jgi:hypothetical protein